MAFNRALADHCLAQGLGYDPVAGRCVALTGGKKPPVGKKKMAQLKSTYGYQLPSSFGYPLPGANGSGAGSLGFTTTTTPGPTSTGGAPSWMCAILGRSSCSYADLVAAGLGYLFGGAGGGSEPPSGNGQTAGNLVPGTSGSGCPAGSIGFPPLCFDLQPGGDVSGGGMVLSQGEAVMGRYGAAMVPQARQRTQLRCLPGMVLGADNLCYNRRDLRKDERKWVPGRKPLLTGGDLNAISRAARAAARVKTTQKRLQKLGLLKKPTTRGRRGSPGVITKSEAAKALRS